MMEVVKEPCFSDLDVGQCFTYKNHSHLYLKISGDSYFCFSSNLIWKMNNFDLQSLVSKVNAKLTWTYQQ
jgi:hypothetical protein